MTNFLSKKIIQFILLFIITVVSYYNIIQNNFAYDDKDFILNWPTIRSLQNIPEIIQGDLPLSHRGLYRPIRGIFYIISYQLYHTNPVLYHIQSIFIHFIVVFLIYLIVYQITKKYLMAFFTSALFAAHPIHTEAITFTTASFDTIGIIFFFLAFYYYLKAGVIKKLRSKKLFYLGSLAYTFLAFYTYEMTLTLPFLIVIYDLTFKKIDKSNLKAKFKPYSAYFSLAALYGLSRFLIYHIGNRADYFGPGLLGAAKNARVGIFEILGKYVQLLVWPNDLSSKYPIPHRLIDFITSIDKSGKMAETVSSVDFLIPIIAIMSVTLLSLKLLHNKPIVAFSICWFFVSLLPAISIIPQGSVIAERFLYIPSFGFSLISAFLFYQTYNFFKKRKLNPFFPLVVICLFIATIGIYSFITHQRNKDWKDSEALFIKAVKSYPSIVFIKVSLAISQAEVGKLDLAINTYKEALQMDPTYVITYFNLALVYEQKGDVESATQMYQKIIEINPTYTPAYANLGYLYQQRGELQKASQQYEQAIKIDANDAYLHYHLGLVYDKQNKLEQALEEYKKTVVLVPYAQAFNNMGIIYGKIRDSEMAIAAFKTSVEIDPGNANAHFNLGNIYQELGKIDLAIEEYQTGLKIKPGEQDIKTRLQKLQQQEIREN